MCPSHPYVCLSLRVAEGSELDIGNGLYAVAIQLPFPGIRQPKPNMLQHVNAHVHVRSMKIRFECPAQTLTSLNTFGIY